MQFCQRCTSLISSKTIGVSLKYYTKALGHKSLHKYISVSVSSTILERQTQTYKRHNYWAGLSNYSDSHAKTENIQTQISVELSTVHNPLPKSRGNAMDLTDGLKYVDLNSAPQLSPFEVMSDEEAIRLIVPSSLPPASFSLRDYVDESETLSKLLHLGVNLWKLEQRPNVGSMLLKLDFQKDVAPRLLFLKELGVDDSRLGYIITHNPFILTESLQNLQTRVGYLRSKKFSLESVASMTSRAPYLLNFSVKRLDNRLGFYQQLLGLSAHKTRDVVERLPRLLCGSLEPVKENLKVCKLELGFKENDIQHIVTIIPKVLTANKMKLTQIFDYVHNTMMVPHHLIVKFPQVLISRYHRIRERHLFLQYLEKAQYDPAQPNYISLDRLVFLPNETFCTEVATAKLEDFDLFLKTL